MSGMTSLFCECSKSGRSLQALPFLELVLVLQVHQAINQLRYPVDFYLLRDVGFDLPQTIALFCGRRGPLRFLVADSGDLLQYLVQASRAHACSLANQGRPCMRRQARVPREYSGLVRPHSPPKQEPSCELLAFWHPGSVGITFVRPARPRRVAVGHGNTRGGRARKSPATSRARGG